jgi:hypothetical protein
MLDFVTALRDAGLFFGALTVSVRVCGEQSVEKIRV